MPFTEDQLLAIYDDLLAINREESQELRLQEVSLEKDANTINLVHGRLSEPSSSSPGTLSAAYKTILSRVGEVVTLLEGSVASSSNLPLSVLSPNEWSALIRVAVRVNVHSELIQTYISIFRSGNVMAIQQTLPWNS